MEDANKSFSRSRLKSIYQDQVGSKRLSAISDLGPSLSELRSLVFLVSYNANPSWCLETIYYRGSLVNRGRISYDGTHCEVFCTSICKQVCPVIRIPICSSKVGYKIVINNILAIYLAVPRPGGGVDYGRSAAVKM